MSFTNFLEGKIADELFGGQAFAAPATLHIGLHSAYPNEAGAGAELSGNGYARVAVTNNLTNWPAYSGDQKQNGTPITFLQATGNWLEAVAISVWDAASSGNVVWGARLAAITPNTDSQDVETKAFAAGQTAQDAHLGTTGQRLHSVDIVISNLDSLADGDMCWLHVFRDASDTTNDTLTGDAIIVGLRLSYSDT